MATQTKPDAGRKGDIEQTTLAHRASVWMDQTNAGIPAIHGTGVTRSENPMGADVHHLQPAQALHPPEGRPPATRPLPRSRCGPQAVNPTSDSSPLLRKTGTSKVPHTISQPTKTQNRDHIEPKTRNQNLSRRSEDRVPPAASEKQIESRDNQIVVRSNFTRVLFLRFRFA